MYLRNPVSQPGMTYCILVCKDQGISNCAPAETMMIGCSGHFKVTTVLEKGLFGGLSELQR